MCYYFDVLVVLTLLYFYLDSPSRIGTFEQGHVEKSLTTSVEIILQLMQPERDPMRHIDVLMKILNYQNTYYMGKHNLHSVCCRQLPWGSN
jgi:hypothetical protein